MAFLYSSMVTCGQEFYSATPVNSSCSLIAPFWLHAPVLGSAMPGSCSVTRPSKPRSSKSSCALQALAKAPAGQLESHSRVWVPLLLAYSAAKASGDVAAAGAAGSKLSQGHAGSADADAAAAAAAAADSEADSDAEEAAVGAATGAAAAEAAEGGQQQSDALASHVGGRAWRAHLKVGQSVHK